MKAAAHKGQPYKGPIFDADMHVWETNAVWDRVNGYLPEKFRKDWSYRMRTGTDGEYCLHIGDRKVEVSGGYYTEDGRGPPPGRLHEWLRAMKQGKENVDMRVPITADQWDRDARMKKLDAWGVDGCIMFIGSMVSSIGFLDQVEPANAVIHAYNRWMSEDWGFNYRNRIYSTPILNLFDLEASVKEAEWAVKQGARIVVMPMGPANGKAPADPAYDRFWSVLNEAGVNVAFHTSEAIHMHGYMRDVWNETPLQSRQRQSAWTWMNCYSERPVIETLSSFIFYNFFARFPKIKLTSVENGAEWVPATLVKMDKSRGMAKLGYWPCGQLKERPSEIFKRNVYVVAYPEDDVRSIVEATGSSSFLMMGSDFPHAEGVPEPADFAVEALGGLSDAEVRDVMHENGRRFLPAAA
ncbi:MAG: amidohydrolase family protein [Gammaproteobacteria bacterium]